MYYATNGLMAYKFKEAQGYLNAILAFTMETAEVPLDFFNNYSLTLRGRTTQGVTAFKNQMQALVEDSKKLSTGAVKDEQLQGLDIPKVFNLHG